MDKCDEIRELLWPMDRPREVVEGEEEALAHLEDCGECRAFFERDALISEVLRVEGVSARAPVDVRERVFDALARERALVPQPYRAGRRGIAVRALPWAATAVAAVGGLALGLSRSGPGVDVAYAQDFLSRAVEADAVEMPDIQAVSALFMSELGVPVTPVVLREAPMSRAMICLIDGRRAAMVEYEMNGYTLAHYRVPLDEGRSSRPKTPGLSEEGGVCVYRWSDGRFQHALVSDMPGDRLQAIAEASFTRLTP